MGLRRWGIFNFAAKRQRNGQLGVVLERDLVNNALDALKLNLTPRDKDRTQRQNLNPGVRELL